MKIPLIILVVSVVLMAVVILLGVAGVIWLAGSDVPTRTGGEVVLVVAALAAAGGLALLWRARPRASA